MDKKIKDIAEKAGCTIDGMGFGEGNIEKLIELVIRECGILADMYNYQVKQKDINPLKTTAYEFINKHFGIEK